MRRILTSFLMIVLFCHPAWGQNTTPDPGCENMHVIGLDVGVAQLMEENLLRRVHGGFDLQPSYEWRQRGERYCVLRFALDYARLAADPEPLEVSVRAALDVSYSHGFPLTEQSSFTLLAGPQARLRYCVSYYPDWDDSHLYWANTLSAEASGTALLALGNEKLLMATLSIPLLTAFSRPDPLRQYKIDDLTFDGIVRNLHSDMRVGFWNRAFLLRFCAEYQFPLSDSMREALVYEMEFIRMEKPGGYPFRELTHTLGLKVQL